MIETFLLRSNFLIIFIPIVLVLACNGQEKISNSLAEKEFNELAFEVKRVHPSVLVTNELLKAASSLIDLNPRYDSSWVSEYVSVEIISVFNGEERSSLSKNNYLTSEQKTQMSSADTQSDIEVVIKYFPDNSLKQNDVKEMSFSFSVEPDIEAKYYGGKDELYNYIEQNTIELISIKTFTGYDFAAVKFSINEKGEISNAHVIESTEIEKINNILLKSITNMLPWQPAKYKNGEHAEQEFVLLVGNMENCNIHLLNIDDLNIDDLN